MPYLLDKIKIGKQYDRRRKLTDKDREEIRRLYREHGGRTLKGVIGKAMSTRALAKRFNVSRRLIQFVIHPERLKALQEHNVKIKHHKIYYDRKKVRKYMAKHRAYKRQLVVENKI